MPKPKNTPTAAAPVVDTTQASDAIFKDISEIDATHGQMSIGKVAVADGTSMSAASLIAAAADHFSVATPAPKEGETRVDHGDFLPGEVIELWQPKLKVKRVHPDAQLPRYATEGAACFDLHALFDEHDPEFKSVVTNRPKEFRTGLAFEVPAGFAMLIYSRSGHGFKNDVRLSNCVGVIDSDYRGEVRVKLTADTVAAHLPVRPGDRIAQAMLVPAHQWEIEEVDELSETERGEGGLGSTGA